MSWAGLTLVFNLILAGKERLNGDNLTVTIEENVLQMETSSEQEQKLVSKEEEEKDEEAQGVEQTSLEPAQVE